MPRLKPGTMRIQKLANLNTVFTFLRSYVKLVDIGPQDVLDGNETRVLGLLWSVISVFSIRSVNLTMPGVRHMGDLKSRLILWGQKNAEATSRASSFLASYPSAPLKDPTSASAAQLPAGASRPRPRPTP